VLLCYVTRDQYDIVHYDGHRERGVLDGKKGTVANSGGAGSVLKKKGCKYSIWSSVVVDGKIITANGPGASKSFAKTIIELLK
jgi:putative intracellular protease/amidase